MPAGPSNGVPEVKFRLRIQYAKSGRLAYLAHLEVLNTVERIIRRAGLPFAVTQGFSPHMRISFGPALGCGTAGLEEYVDVFLTTFVEPDEALERLRLAAMPGLMPVRVWYVCAKAPSLTVFLNAFSYEVEIAFEDGSVGLDDLSRAITTVCERGSIEIARKKKGARTILLDEMLLEDVSVEASAGGAKMCLMVRNGERGTMRPEIFLDAVRGELTGEITVRRLTRKATYHEENGVYTAPYEEIRPS